MLNLTVNCKNCSYVCAYRCSQWYTIQHRTVLIIFPLILETVIIAQTLPTGGEAEVIETQCTQTLNDVLLLQVADMADGNITNSYY